MENKGQKIAILYEDEKHYQLKPNVSYTYSPDPKPVIPLYYQKQEKVSTFGMIEIMTGQLFLGTSATANKFTFIEYIKSVQENLIDYDQIWIILDGASYHHLTKEELKLLIPKPQVTLIFLPAASPELNPAEEIWRLLKPQYSNDPHKTIESIIDVILSNDLRKTPSLCESIRLIFTLN